MVTVFAKPWLVRPCLKITAPMVPKSLLEIVRLEGLEINIKECVNLLVSLPLNVSEVRNDDPPTNLQCEMVICEVVGPKTSNARLN